MKTKLTSFARSGLWLAWLVLAAVARANILSVTNPNDSGPGSLRQAVAEAGQGGATIYIDLPGPPYPTITLTSGEIVIGRDLTIFGTSTYAVTMQFEQTPHPDL